MTKTYTKDVGFVSARTNYKLFCWVTDSNNPLDSETMSYKDIITNSQFFTTVENTGTQFEMSSVSESGFFEYSSIDTADVKTSVSSLVSVETSGLSATINNPLSTGSDNNCNAYQDDMYFLSSRIGSSPVTGKNVQVYFNGVSTTYETNLRNLIFWTSSTLNYFAHSQCGYRTVTYTSTI